MQNDRYACIVNGVYGCDDVRDVAMDATIRNDAHDVGASAGFLKLGNKGDQRIGFGKAAVLDRQVDLSQIHCNHASSADIGMTNLRVAHLAAWQTNVRTMCPKLARWAIHKDRVKCRCVCQCGGVCVCFGAFAPAIQNAQNYGFGSAHGLLLLLGIVIPVRSHKEQPRDVKVL